MQNENDKENPKEIINSDDTDMDRKYFENIAEKHKTAVNEVFQEIFEKGLFDIKLKNHQPNKDQDNVEEDFLEIFMGKYSEKIEKIQEEENYVDGIEIYPIKDQDNRRKDVFVRTLIYYCKKQSPDAKALIKTQEIEDKINISHPVILGLVVFLSIGSNTRDKEMMENYCNKYSYWEDGEKYFHWGGDDGKKKGIFDDEKIEKLANKIISNLARTISNLEKSRIISLSHAWLKKKEIDLRGFDEDQVGELLSVLKGITGKHE